MELYFDNHIQGKSFDLRPELPLIVYLWCRKKFMLTMYMKNNTRIY
jgi:hypothetical protein